MAYVEVLSNPFTTILLLVKNLKYMRKWKKKHYSGYN